MYWVEIVFATGLRHRSTEGYVPHGLGGGVLLDAARGHRRDRLGHPLPALRPACSTRSHCWTGPGGPAFAWVVGASVLYWLGGRHGAHARPSDGERWRTASFVAGLATIVIALDSPIDELAEKLLWVHMVQHILLLVVAPPLLALARPWNRMWHGLPLGFRRRTRAAWSCRARAGARFGAIASVLQDPLPSWLGLQRDLLAWHVPAAYDATLHSQLVHALEHAMFFGTALLFWTRVIDSPAVALATRRRCRGRSTSASRWWSAGCSRSPSPVSTAPVYAPYADGGQPAGRASRRSPISSWPPG